MPGKGSSGGGAAEGRDGYGGEKLEEEEYDKGRDTPHLGVRV